MKCDLCGKDVKLLHLVKAYDKNFAAATVARQFAACKTCISKLE